MTSPRTVGGRVRLALVEVQEYVRLVGAMARGLATTSAVVAASVAVLAVDFFVTKLIIALMY